VCGKKADSKYLLILKRAAEVGSGNGFALLFARTTNMPHSVSITTTSGATGSLLPGASNGHGKAAAGNSLGGAFGTLFREKVVETDEAKPGQSAEAKAGWQALAQQKIMPDAQSAATHVEAAATSENNSAKVDVGLVKRILGGAESMDVASGDVQAQASKITDEIAAGAGLHSAMGKPLTKVDKGLIAASMGGLSDAGQAASDAKAGAVSDIKTKSGATPSSSVAALHDRHKETASVVSTGAARVITHGIAAAASVVPGAPAPVPAGKALADVAVSATGSECANVAVQLGGSAILSAGQPATQKLSAFMAPSSEAATPISSLEAKSASSGVNAFSAGDASRQGHEKVSAELHDGHAIDGHEAPGHAAGGTVLAQAGSASLLPAQHESHVAGAERAVLPQAALSVAVSNHQTSGTAVVTLNAASPFDRIDQGASAVMLHAGSQHVEVGVHDPQLGWVEISAQNAAGHVDAKLIAASAQTQSTLAAQLPGIAQYLQERDVRVGTLAVHQLVGQTGAGSGQAGGHSGSHAGSGGSGSQHFRGSGSGTTENEIPVARMGRSFPATIPHMTEGVALGPVSYISVRA
jgi:Flagellar hook-length control protein FliK